MCHLPATERKDRVVSGACGAVGPGRTTAPHVIQATSSLEAGLGLYTGIAYA